MNTDLTPVSKPQLIQRIHQFYYHEARLLDERQYQRWLDLLAPGIRYTMPNRANTQSDKTLKNTDAMLNIEQELSQDLEAPLRDDDFLSLSFRANRPSSPLAVADNPLLRTVRLVSNIEVYKQNNKSFKVYNKVSMSYSRHAQDNHIFFFSREDELKKISGEFKLSQRRIIMDWNVVTAPTVALIL